MPIDAPEKMFSFAAETVRRIGNLLYPGWTYRAEYLRAPKHNTLEYGRVPVGHLIIFDIDTGLETYLDYHGKRLEAERIGLESVPVLYTGIVTPAMLQELLTTDSILGKVKIEGVVVKPLHYNIFGPDKKCIFGKYVSPQFKEMHAKAWKQENPTSGDVLDALAASLKTEARWEKSVQHLRDRGVLSNSPKDIGGVIKECVTDVEKECADEIKERLWQWAWPHLRRMVVAGMPEWYKEKLLKESV
jgi:hypothetical protein